MIDVDMLTKSINDAIQLEKFDIPPLPKQVDLRGYLYVLIDTAYPTYVKIGKTSCPKKRLQGYNSDRPIATCRFIWLSKIFEDYNKIEDIILSQLYLEIQPVGKSKEWFDIKHKDLLISWIEKAEKETPDDKSTQLPF